MSRRASEQGALDLGRLGPVESFGRVEFRYRCHFLGLSFYFGINYASQVGFR